MTLLWALVTVASAAACDRGGGEPSSEALAIRLEPQGRPPLDVVVDVRPKVSADQIVEPLASLLGQALGSCPGPLPDAMLVKLVVQSGSISAESLEDADEPAAACLVRELGGKTLRGLTGRREIMLRASAVRR